jgi:transposase
VAEDGSSAAGFWLKSGHTRTFLDARYSRLCRHMPERQAQEVILRNRLGIAYVLRSEPGAEYRDLGLGYCERRRHRRRTTSHVRSLE